MVCIRIPSCPKMIEKEEATTICTIYRQQRMTQTQFMMTLQTCYLVPLNNDGKKIRTKYDVRQCELSCVMCRELQLD